jgi:hypothetical protein
MGDVIWRQYRDSRDPVNVTLISKAFFAFQKVSVVAFYGKPIANLMMFSAMK